MKFGKNQYVRISKSWVRSEKIKNNKNYIHTINTINAPFNNDHVF